MSAACNCTERRVENALKEAQGSEMLNSIKSARDGLPWAGAFRAPDELFAVVRLLKPDVVVETGVGIGLSTAHILVALALNDRGRLISIDLPNADPGWTLPSSVPPGFLVPEAVRNRWEFRQGNTFEVLPPVLAREKSIGLFVHDSEHTYETMMFEFTQCWKHLSPNGLIISDDAAWNAALLEVAALNRRKVGFIYHTGGSLPIAYLKR